MISPLMVVSLEQGKLYPEQRPSGLEEDVACAKELRSRPMAQPSRRLFGRFLTLLHLAKRQEPSFRNLTEISFSAKEPRLNEVNSPQLR